MVLFITQNALSKKAQNSGESLPTNPIGYSKIPPALTATGGISTLFAIGLRSLKTLRKIAYLGKLCFRLVILSCKAADSRILHSKV